MDHWLKFLSDDESHLQKQKSEQQHNHQHLFDSRYPIKSKDRDNLHSHRKVGVYNGLMQPDSVRVARLIMVHQIHDRKTGPYIAESVNPWPNAIFQSKALTEFP